MKLSILIPTYNRAPFLLKNLEMLAGYIRKGTFQKEIEIVVSNNKSTDSTDEKVIQFQNQNTDIQLQYFIQDENIGLEKNALFVLRQAKGEYVMYLGDDDYIEFNYLKKCYSYIDDTSIHCIIPANKSIDEKGNELSGGRDLISPTKKYESGFKNCLTNAYRGHQLSGLVLKRNELHSSYLNSNVKNIYPFIYFVGLSCLKGDTVHLTRYPVKITAAPQSNKDWSYGKDGLMNEIFDNYIKLPLSNYKKTQLQLHHYRRQSWRLFKYLNQSYKAFHSAFMNILLSNNSTIGFKTIFPFIVLIQSIKKIIRRLFK